MIAPPLLAFALLFTNSPARTNGAPSNAEWIDLFDGQSLAHLSGDPKFWSVENGAIVGRSTAENPCTRTTYLAWDGSLADFELVAQIRLHGGNSGLQYRSRVLDGFDVEGYQADFEAGPNYCGILYEQGGRGIAASRGEQVEFLADGSRRVSGSLGDAAALQRAIKPDDWNEYRVMARGPRLVHWINGVKMVDVIDRDPNRAAHDGTIAIQLHQGGPMQVEVRSLRARKLTDGPRAAKPEWIWTKKTAGPNEPCFLRKRFTLDEPARFAELSVAADDRHITYIDRTPVARGKDWMTAQVVDVTRQLAAGEHVLAVEAQNNGPGVGAVALSLHVELASGRAVTIASDATFKAFGEDQPAWDAPAFDDSAWPAAFSFGWNVPPWSAFGDPFRPAEATPADQVRAPDGFRVERICSAQRGQGSWVAMTFDDKGRVIVSPESGRILRIDVSPSGAGGVSFDSIELPVGNAQGLAFHDGALFVSANAEVENGGGLWRCIDHDGDGKFEDSKRIVEYGPDGEHGGHGVVPGPDGWLWVTCGNHTHLPPNFDADSPHQDWAEDLALPREWDPNGHAVSIYAPGAYVLRVKQDGSQVKLFCAGMRNMYDLAFDERGEAFTFDSDMEWDLGLPWYVPTRICHLVSGADFGWRSGSGRWPAWYPDALPAAVDIGLSSPTGVTFGTKSAFPAKWKHALFVCDWAYGRILAVHLDPRGSSFGGSFEPFVSGKPLPVTDLEVGPDGALWFTIGGRGAQAGLYRVTWTGGADAGGDAIADDAASAAARAERHRLEAFHGHEDARAVDACWDALDSDDPFLRHAARVAIEAQDPKTWRERALAETRPTAMRTALLALARVGDGGRGDLDAILERLRTAKLERTTAAWRDEARVIEVAICRKGAPTPAVAAATRERVRAAFPSGDFELDRELFAVLHQLGDDDLPARTVPLLESLKDPVQQIQFGFDLRDVTAGWTPDLSARYAAWYRTITADTTQGIAVKGFSWRGFLKQIEPALGAVGLAPAEPVAQHVEAPAATGESKWSLDKLSSDLDRADHGRSFAAGKEVFTRALCANCHRFAGMGGASSLGGPDLTGVASRFSRRDLIETILAPSKVISDQYRLTEFTKKDGSVVLGRLVNEDQFTNYVLVDPLNPQRVAIDKKDLKQKRPARTSAMPERLLEPLSLDEILDLVAYLESGGDPASPRFH